MTTVTIPQALDLAIRHQNSKRFVEAESIYRQILAQRPDDPDALHLLGVLLYQTGRTQLAVDMIRRAIVIDPATADFHSNLGDALKSLGKPQEALAACEAALRLRPEYPEALNNLASALVELRRPAEAIEALRHALRLRPQFPEALNNLGIAQKDLGSLDEAMESYQRALALRPAYAEAINNLGNVHKLRWNIEEAMKCYRAAIALRPEYYQAYSNLGDSLREAGRLEESAAACARAIAIRPDFADANTNLGSALSQLERHDEAIARHLEAIRLKPDSADAYCNLGNAYQPLNRLEEAADACRKSIALRPELATGHWNLALTLLTQGKLAEGWREMEWRWDVRQLGLKRRTFAQPEWDGGDLDGRKILLHAEQGFGDTIQFVRYATLVARRGGRVIVECQKELVELLRSLDGVEQVLARHAALPAFDVHCPLMSLPLKFGTTLEDIPAEMPYLAADVDRVRFWSERLQSGGRMKAGLAWAGTPGHKNDRNRSLPLAQLARLGTVPGLQFYSLQMGPAAEQAKAPPGGMTLHDYTSELKDFADTAAMMIGLDMVVTVDTSIAHLAGALGKRVWVLLAFTPDWRWMMNRTDSPWYPTARLYRQRQPRGWDEVIERVATDLSGMEPRINTNER